MLALPGDMVNLSCVVVCLVVNLKADFWTAIMTTNVFMKVGGCQNFQKIRDGKGSGCSPFLCCGKRLRRESVKLLS